MDHSIWKYESISSFRDCLPKKKIVLAGGCFDIIHFGHVQFLTEAKKQGDILVIALESDDFILKTKNRTPIHTQDERAYILQSLRAVDYVILLPLMTGDHDYAALVKNIKPEVIAVTQDDPHIEHKRRHSQEIHAEVVIVIPRLSTFSSRFIAHNEDIYRS